MTVPVNGTNEAGMLCRRHGRLGERPVIFRLALLGFQSMNYNRSIILCLSIKRQP